MQEEPDDSVMQRLFSTMDTDGNGTIELKEFLAVMGDWMGADEWEKRRKGSSTVADERIGVHQSIKSFFEQFNDGGSGDSFGAARQKLKDRLFTQSMSMDQMENEDDSIIMGGSHESDDQAKLAALNYANECVLNFNSVMAGLGSNNPYQQLEATKAVCQLLSLVVLFKSPLERRSITTVLVKIYHLMYDGGVMNRIMSFLSISSQPPLQFQALKALTLYCPGPRIASTPPTHDLHPDKMFFKRHMKNMNCIPLVYGLLDHSLADIREQAVACLGAFAAQHPAARDYLLQNNGLAPIMFFAQPSQPISMLRKVSFVLACMVGYTHPTGFQPDFGLIKPALPPIASLTYSNDEEVIRNTMAAMALVLPVVPEPNMLQRVLDILSWQAESQAQSVTAALKVAEEVIKMDHTQTKALIERQLLVRLKNLLRHNLDSVKLRVIDVLITLVIKGQAQSLFESKIIPTLLEMLATDKICRTKTAHLFRLITNGTPQQISYLVLSCDIIQKLAAALSFFKEYDAVLAKVYRYMGPSYHFPFVLDLITALHNVVNVGFMISEQSGDNNQYALKFTMGALDQMKNLLNLMATNSEEEKSWRKAAEAEGGVSSARVEELIASLLVKIKKANDRAANSESRVVSTEITSIWERFFGKSKTAGQSSEQSVFFKCIMQGAASGQDIRIMELPKDRLTFQGLLDTLQRKYHRRLIVQFKDSDGDQVVLDSEGAMKRAFLSARNNTIMLFLRDEGDLMTHAQEVQLSSSATQLELSPTNSPMVGKRSRPKLDAIHTEGSAHFEFRNAPKEDFGKIAAVPVSQIPAVKVPTSPQTKNWMAGIESLQSRDRSLHLQEMNKQANLSEPQLKALHETFRKLSDGEGYINRYKFSEGLKSIGITNDLLIEQNWNAFDEDRDGKVSIQEFITAVGIMSSGSVQDKLRFVFQMYDANGDGSLDREELLQIFKVSASLKGTYIPLPQLKRMVEETFKEIDLNHDGTLDFSEFELAIQKNQLEVHTRVAFV